MTCSACGCRRIKTPITGYLERNGIDTEGVKIDNTGAVTGLAFTEIKSPEDCSILMYRDNVADLLLHPSDVSEAYIRRSKALLISGTALAQSPSREAVVHHPGRHPEHRRSG